MVKIIQEKEILSIVKKIDVVATMKEAFIAYSNGKAVIPSVGELLFEKPKGETHIIYGYIKDDDFFCIKIASGFYENTNLGISSSQGMMLLFSQKTGEPKAILLDGGHLTNIRTAAAGALAAKYFAPKTVKAIGIIGTGIQGRLQLQYLQNIKPCKKVWIWDLYPESAMQYKSELQDYFDIQIATNPAEVAKHCNLIITTTPSESPLLHKADILSGTHITAVGSDTSEKQELSAQILHHADLVISDSITQSKTRGEIYQASKYQDFKENRITELGTAIQDKNLCRTHNNQISVVDLTGVAVQDIMIAKAVYNRYIINNH
ncbi:MAG: ornithine cyclodeaminase family protein [Bacteroidetes bacterium HGW-Bacteroidetes-17]|jgi:ornithine cyclodeaminase|nr:MAG: ornithine cyclodeaminase family protein [Bacteroidetes bacterium HGW-Bacteroidetes-17]